MGQKKGNPSLTLSVQNQAYSNLYTNNTSQTGTDRRDGGTKPVMIDDVQTLSDVVDVSFATDAVLSSVSSSINTIIGTKLDTSTYTSFSSSLVNNKLDTSTYTSFSSSLVYVTSSTWTPTISNKTGVFVADATVNSAYYTQIGNIVQATFNISWTVSGESTAGGFNFTLPVLPNNNFSNTTSIAGTGTWYNASNDGAARVGSGNGSKLGYYSVSTINANGSETFINVQYKINN